MQLNWTAMGPLLPVYVALSALNFQFVTACQDGRFALLFFVLFYYNFWLLLSSLDYCLFYSFNVTSCTKKFLCHDHVLFKVLLRYFYVWWLLDVGRWREVN